MGFRRRAKDGKYVPIHTIKVNNKEYTFKELSEETGLSLDTLRARVRKGDQGERIIRPQRKARRIKYLGRVYESRGGLMKEKDLTLSQVRYRLKLGMAEYMEEAN